MATSATVALTGLTVSGGQPGWTLAIGSGLLALLLNVLFGALGHRTVTLAHEGAHAVAILLLGGTVKAVRLGEAGGQTEPDGIGGIALFPIALIGYFGASLLGLFFAAVLNSADPLAVLWVTVILLALLLVAIRGFYGTVQVWLVGGVFGLAIRYGSESLQTWTAYTWTWFLLLGGVSAAFRLHTARQSDRNAGQRDTRSDAYRLRSLTYTPAVLWVAIFILGTIIALLVGALMLLGIPVPIPA
jgi:hypothetical protein